MHWWLYSGIKNFNQALLNVPGGLPMLLSIFQDMCLSTQADLFIHGDIKIVRETRISAWR